jgi:hypothetical protein
MDPAKVSSSFCPVQERADRKIIMGERVSHLECDEIIKLFGFEIGAVHPGTVAFTCGKILEDILPALL